MTAIRSEDERFAEFLRITVPELDAAPAVVPREEMWTRIVAQRHGHALLSLAGEEVGRDGDDLSVPVTVPTPDCREVLRRVAARGRRIPLVWTMPLLAAGVALGVVLGVRLGGRQGSPDGVPRAPVSVASRFPKELPAQLVAQRHFQEVKQLLNTFAEAKASGRETRKVDAEMVARARDLLSTTQLLLDSPLGMDPQRRHLLTDIELVLTQITQLAPSAPAEDRDLVEQSIEHSQVVPRLQHVAPRAPEETVQSGT